MVMEYRVYQPHPGLSRFIKCYWTLESGEIPVVSSRERIFPDGCMELVFHFGDLFRKYKRDTAGETQGRSFIHGQLTKYMELEATGKTGIFSVRFKPGGLQPFMDIDPGKLTGDTLGLYDCWKHEGEVL